MRCFGADWSGARDAGRKIWLGEVDGDGRLLALRRGPPLLDLIAGGADAVFGLDFPFALPRALMAAGTWEEFVLDFPRRYPDPDAFRRACLQAAGGREWRRATDRERRAPFSPYNLRLYRQTYHGIRDLLRPLVAGGLACVLPMQPPRPGRPWVIEVCPASTLKQEGLYRPYKGRSPAHRAARAEILRRLFGRDDPAILDDPGGDALDGAIAALAARRALPRLAACPGEPYTLEGYIFA